MTFRTVALMVGLPPHNFFILSKEKDNTPHMARSRSEKAGLSLSVPRVNNKLRDLRLSKRTAASASVFVTGALETIISTVVDCANAEVCEGRANKPNKKTKTRLRPHHISKALNGHPDLHRLFQGFAFVSSEDCIQAHALIRRAIKKPRVAAN